MTQNQSIKLPIKPFNKFLFRSCFYQQLISAYNFYGIDEKLILLNSLPVYFFNAKEKKSGINEIEILSNCQLEAITGIRRKTNRIKTNPVNDIVCSIQKDTPVILAVDCYELPYFRKAFKIQHKIHYILIYGYDLDEKSFIICEIKFENCDYYDEKIISFELIAKAFNSYVKYLSQKSGISSITLQKVSESKEVSAPAIYAEFLQKNKKSIKKSIERLCLYLNFIKEIISYEETLCSHSDSLIEFFENCKIKKIVQKNQLSYIFENSCLHERILDRIIENCTFIYGVLLKMKLTGRHNILSVEKIIQRMDEIAGMEEQLAGILINEV